MLRPLDDGAGGALCAERARRPIFPIEARGISLADRGRRLLDDVSLTMTHGPRTVIMGPNGAGKSLLLRVLHGLAAPDAGSVTWAGRAADSEIMARQAMVFQKPTLLRRSARANIEFVLSHLDSRAAARKSDEILAQARLVMLADSPARLLSGGEQQRLAIARALALEPDVLFLDEPCANLDPASTLAVEEMIEAAREGGTKIVLVTHDIGQARRIADEVVFMSSGRIAEHAPATSFFAAPTSAAARAYLAGQLHIDGASPAHSIQGARS